MSRQNSSSAGPITELTGVVVPPAPKCVVGFDRACVRCPGADVVPCNAGDLCWDSSVGCGSIAELSGAVVAPAPKCVISFGAACLICP